MENWQLIHQKCFVQQIRKKQPFEAMDQQLMSQQHQPNKHFSEESCSGAGNPMAEIERKKLYYLDRIVKEQEKTNMRLHSLIENQKQEFRNHDRMIDLLYRIAFNK